MSFAQFKRFMEMDKCERRRNRLYPEEDLQHVYTSVWESVEEEQLITTIGCAIHLARGLKRGDKATEVAGTGNDIL